MISAGFRTMDEFNEVYGAMEERLAKQGKNICIYMEQYFGGMAGWLLVTHKKEEMIERIETNSLVATRNRYRLVSINS